MPDRDLSYIDDELKANDESITWMGSGDSASSTDVDPRLSDDTVGDFDYGCRSGQAVAP